MQTNTSNEHSINLHTLKINKKPISLKNQWSLASIIELINLP